MYPLTKTFKFSKYQAHGNDFILIDDRELVFPICEKFIQKLCSRHFGIGADGCILLQSSTSCLFGMRIFNEDGSEATMCGNGIRCLAHFISSRVDKKEFLIETKAGPKKCLVSEEIEVDMGKVDIQRKLRLDSWDIVLVDSGVPHAVIFVPSVEAIDVEVVGREIRFHKNLQPDGVNVTFVEVSGDFFKIRTYERGLERESLSCGTGACASAMVIQNIFRGKDTIDIYTRSGKLKICVNDFGCNMTGPVTHVFDGEYTGSLF